MLMFLHDYVIINKAKIAKHIIIKEISKFCYLPISLNNMGKYKYIVERKE